MNEEDAALLRRIAHQAAEEVLQDLQKQLLDLLNAFEAGIAQFKHHTSIKYGVETIQPPAVKEETFTCLKYETKKGARIGEYEIAYQEHNSPENWSHAYNILKQNNATIDNRYYGIGYGHSYWLYGEGKIYRQKLSQAQQNQQKKETLAGTRTFFY